MAYIKEKGLSVWDTSHGLYGSSNMWAVFELFKQISLEQSALFIDLGSGDGRITFLASLFTTAVGIEGDPELHAIAEKAKTDLGISCTLINGDYQNEDLRSYDVLFIYADHSWPAPFQEKLLRECKGVLYSLHNIYKPDKLPKGKTLWIEQTPFITYPLNT